MTDDAPVRLKLEPGFPSQGEMKLRVSPDDAKALAELIEAEGLRCGRLMEFSAVDPNSTVAYLVYGVGAGAAALDRLARAISPWSHRHDGKSIELYEGGEVKTVTGFSPDEARAILEKIAERQREVDQQWDEQALGRHRAPAEEPDAN